MMPKIVLITGGDGLVGSSFQKIEKLHSDLFFVRANRQVADLTNELEVKYLFNCFKPNYVIHAGARVGGIQRNLNSPVQQFNDNILMNTFMTKYAFEMGVEKFIGFGSVCAFPGDAKILKEEDYLKEEPFPAHKSYAYTKRMMAVQLEAYRQQYGFDCCTILPTNVYGIKDNYNLIDAHVVPSLIHKCYLAKEESKPFEIWGDGESFREFIYAEDVARICLDLLKRENKLPPRLILPGVEIPIRDLVSKICSIFDYHKINFDTSKPNGQRRRPTDRTLFNSNFPDFKFTDLNNGLKESIGWFVKEYPHVRL